MLAQTPAPEPLPTQGQEALAWVSALLNSMDTSVISLPKSSEKLIENILNVIK